MQLRIVKSLERGPKEGLKIFRKEHSCSKSIACWSRTINICLVYLMNNIAGAYDYLIKYVCFGSKETTLPIEQLSSSRSAGSANRMSANNS